MGGGRKKTNPVHEYFDFSEELNMSRCQIRCSTGEICNHQLKGQHASNLERHVCTTHPETFLILSKTKINMKRKILEEASSSQKKMKSCQTEKHTIYISATDVIDACVELVTVNGRPFKILEDSGFRKLLDPILQAVGGNLCINCHNIRNEISARAEKIRSSLKEEVNNSLVSLKVDTATRLDRSIMGINIQYVNNGKLHLRTLGTKELFVAHTGENIKFEIFKILSIYNLDGENIYSITTDNAANMLKAVKLLSQTRNEQNMICDSEDNNPPDLDENIIEISDIEDEEGEVCEMVLDESESTNESENEEDPKDTIEDTIENLFHHQNFDVEIQSVRCASHTLQLAVNDVLKKKNIKNVMNKVRAACKTLRTPSTLLTLKTLGIRKPPIDVPTRWSSTFNMAKSVLDAREIFHEITNVKSKKQNAACKMTEQTWQELKNIVDALEPAKIATNKLQEEQLVMGDFLNAWLRCKFETKKLQTDIAKELYIAMEKREKDLFNCNAFRAAIFMDPRYKVLLSNDDILAAKNHLKKIWERLRKQSTNDTMHTETLTYQLYV